jgi:sulfatase maturation enzyme AslB (radical SAM superfamily)
MKPISNTFCAIPFVSMMVNTDTTVRYCCMVKGSANKLKKEDGKFFTIQDQFVEHAWNGKDMRDIRTAMIQGNRVEGCSTCYLQEEAGRESNRVHANNEWAWRLGDEELEQRVRYAKINGGVVNKDIVYLDLRLGNLCNLKCRMCNPWNSSQIAKEHKDIVIADSDYSKVWAKTFGKFPEAVMKNQEWFESDLLWDQVIKLIPELKKVYMTGGEPTLIDHNFKFMQECIDQGRKDILLFFNTNCTNVNQKFTDLVSQFDEININASLDGIGVINEYVRPPSKWSQLEVNVEKLAALPNIKLGVTPTVQVYNVFNLVETLTWVDELNKKYKKKIFVDLLINIHPHQLNVNILPDSLRAEALKMLTDYRDKKMPWNVHDLTKNSVNGIIGLLQQPRAEDWAEQLARLQVYTKSLDTARKQDYKVLDSRIVNFINGKI